MKKIIMVLALITLTLGNSVFAGNEIDKRVQKAFEKEFAGAVDVRWSTYEEFIKVDFTFNDVRLIACYNTKGETLAVMRNIQSSSLPLVLQFDLGKNYKDYWITQLFELVNKEGTQYHITIENADRVVQLQSNGREGWEFIGKELKK